MKKKIALLLSAVFVFSMLSGCGGDDAGSQNQEQEANQNENSGGTTEAADNSTGGSDTNETRTLVIAHGAYPQTLDIQHQSDVYSSRPAAMVFQTLVANAPDGSFFGVLAEDWEYVDDTTIKFSLRKDVKFHNGGDFTAKDVEWSLKRAIASPHVSSKAAFIDPDKFNIIDDHTIEVGFLYPNASALYMFAQAGLSMLPSELYDGVDSADISDNPIGTGPYQYVSTVNGESVSFTRFDGYWGEPAKIKDLEWRTITENANRTIELETGGAHFSYDILTTDVDRIEDSSDLTLFMGPSFTIQYVCYNTEKAPLNDVRVRRALGMAVDKESILYGVYNGLGKPGVGPMVEGTEFSTNDLDVDGYDLDAARALLAEAGYGDGLELRIYTNENQARIDAAQIVQNSWEQIGVSTSITTLEYAAYYDAVNSGEYDVCFFGWVSNGDPDNTMYGLYHSSMVGASNYSHTTNADVDRLLEEGRKELDNVKREQIYVELQETLVDYVPATYYWQGVNTHGYTNDLGYIEYTPYNLFPWEWSFVN